MIADQQAPVHVVERRLRQVVQILMRDHERFPVGREGHSADVVRRRSCEPIRSARRRVSTTARRPPKASATTSFEPSPEVASSRGQNGSSRSPEGREAAAFVLVGPLAIDTNVSRRDQREATAHDAPSASRASRTGSGLTLQPIEHPDRAIVIVQEQELIRCFIDGEQTTRLR